MAEETPEYTTTRQDTLERHEIIVPEFVQRTFSPQQLGLRALLGLLRAGTSPLSASRSYASRPRIDRLSPREYPLCLHPPPLLQFLPPLLPLPCWDPSAASQSYSPSF